MSAQTRRGGTSGNNIEFRKEAGRQRNPRKREEHDCENPCQERPPPEQSAIIVYKFRFAVRSERTATTPKAPSIVMKYATR